MSFPLISASTTTGFQIPASLRLRSSATGFISWTPINSTSYQKGVISMWCKRGAISSANRMHLYQSSYNASPYRSNSIQFETDNTLGVYFAYQTVGGGSWNNSIYLSTTAVYRDVSAWYHIYFMWDTTQATASDRASLFVNGVKVTSFVNQTYPALNESLVIDTNGFTNFIGDTNGKGVFTQGTPYDGYIAEFHRVDGYTPSVTQFGQFDSDGNWKAKQYTGSYGANGFYLKFSNTTTITALVADYSGNNKTFTPNNISLANDSTYDAMRDVPLGFGGGEFGNYAILNPLSVGGGTILNGNITASSASDSYKGYKSTLSLSDKVYWEVRIQTAAQVVSVGVASADWVLGLTTGQFFYHYDGGKYINGVNLAYGAPSFTTGDLIGFTFEKSTGTVICYKNNVSCGALITGLSGEIFAACTIYGTGSVAYNFGQRPFAYAPPAGFRPLHTGVFIEPLIANPRNQFNTFLYQGDGTNNRAISMSNFDPGFVWFKSRSAAWNNAVVDVVRGNSKILLTNQTAASGNFTGYADFGSVGSNQMVINYNGSAGPTNEFNYNGTNYVSWLWKAGSSTVTNTDGSITSQVSANPAAGFSIVAYTGTGANATVGHGLGSAPKMIIIKAINAANDWPVYHASLTFANVMYLNATNAAANALTVWNNTAPTSSVFSIGTGSGVNTASQTQIAYCFSEITGYSKIGSYIGNGSADGTFVYCGFRPSWIMIKRSDSASATGWYMYDTTRDPYNYNRAGIIANSTSAEAVLNEGAGGGAIDTLSTGFKLRGTYSDVNASGGTYVFIAFAESPLKYALAR